MWADSRLRRTKPSGPFWSWLAKPGLCVLVCSINLPRRGHILLAYFLLKHLLCFVGSMGLGILLQAWNKVPTRCTEEPSFGGCFSILLSSISYLTFMRILSLMVPHSMWCPRHKPDEWRGGNFCSHVYVLFSCQVMGTCCNGLCH